MPSISTNTRVGPKGAEANAKMQALQKRFIKLVKGIQDAAPEAVRGALQPIKDRADYYCPVDTGKMKESGYLVVLRRGDKTIAELGYGKGGRPFYAPIVHERTDAKHKAPTRAKWLQSALNEQLSLVPGRVARALKAQVDMVARLASRT